MCKLGADILNVEINVNVDCSKYYREMYPPHPPLHTHKNVYNGGSDFDYSRIRSQFTQNATTCDFLYAN